MRIAGGAWLIAWGAPALGWAQAAALPPTVAEVVITAPDPAGLLEKKPNDTILGLDKPLLATPRSASFISDTTLERYGAVHIDDLTAVSPGAFTDSYYGVAGSLNIRGTLAENYFRGFKRIEDRGTYPTPIGAADRIEIVRGPPTPIDGPGKVGGYLNFTPKTARSGNGFIDQPTGAVEAGIGAYGQAQLDAQIGLPVNIGRVRGGVFVYGEAVDDGDYYSGIDPKHQLGQLSADFDLGDGWRTAFGGEIYRSTGAVQTVGWNRLTQNLVDHRQYTTGRNTFIQDTNGDGRLEPGEIGAGVPPQFGGPAPLEVGYFGFPPAPDPRFTLDTGVGTARIGRRTVFDSAADFSTTDTHTYYGDLSRDFGADRTLKLQLFYDDLSNQRFVSYGFPADYRAEVEEGRATFTSKDVFLGGAVTAHTVTGLSYRSYDGRQQESFNGGYIALDRRDLIHGATPTDIFASPFMAANATPWETDVKSHIGDAGAFLESDIDLPLRLNLVGGARADSYHVTSRDDGTVVFGATLGQRYVAGRGSFTWNAALTYTQPVFGWGTVLPYISYAHTAAPELSQAGGVAPNLIAANAWLAPSNLREAGLKWRLFRDRLTGALSIYRQTRTELGQGNVVVGTKGRGAELELRWLIDPRFSLTFAGNLQRTTIKGPDSSFTVIPPSVAGVSDVDGYGGTYAVFALSQIRPGSYTDTLIPRSVDSLYGTYTSLRHGWGRAGATLGATYVSTTSGVIPNAVHFPNYVTLNASAFYEHGPWRLSANVDNLTDKLYFTPVADVYSNVAALPSIGRTWRLKLRRSF